MNPYRQAPTNPPEVKFKPRSKSKTLWLKFLVWWNGPWKKRFIRCSYCNKFVWQPGDGLDPEGFFHMVQCFPKHSTKE